MPNIIDTLKQTEWWYVWDGMPVKLVDMEPEYRVNLLYFLQRRAKSLYDHFVWQTTGEEDEPAAALTEDAEAWLARAPLVLELARLIMLNGSVDGEVVEDHEVIESARKELTS